jgi:hypothetical protein
MFHGVFLSNPVPLCQIATDTLLAAVTENTLNQVVGPPFGVAVEVVNEFRGQDR